MQSIRKLGAAVLILLALGCTTHHQNSSLNRKEVAALNKSYDPRLISFADTMDVLVVDTRQTYEGPFLKIMFELMNRKNADVTHPVYQIEWLDENGFVKAITAWKPVVIKGNQTVKIVEMAPVQGVSTYKITLSNKER